VKISFPRPVTAGSFEDRDLHAGQQHVPLAGLRLPGITAERPAQPPIVRPEGGLGFPVGVGQVSQFGRTRPVS
jgi:hypothetical protein